MSRENSSTRVLYVILLMTLTCAYSIGYPLWPEPYTLYFHLGEFALVPLDFVTGSRCVHMKQCTDCVLFVMIQQLFYIPRFMLSVMFHLTQQFLLHIFLYVSTGFLCVLIFCNFHEDTVENIINESQSVNNQTTTRHMQIENMRATTIPFSEAQHIDCVICMEEKEDQVTALPCAHVFHNDCISRWLLIQHRCPTCNYEWTDNTV
jgi:hypothetical protein